MTTAVRFSHPQSGGVCDGCGEYPSRCRCVLDEELLREGPLWAPDKNVRGHSTKVPLDDGWGEGFHVWDGDRPRALDGARWTDLPGIIREAIRHIDDPDQYCEVMAWLETIGYIPTSED